MLAHTIRGCTCLSPCREREVSASQARVDPSRVFLDNEAEALQMAHNALGGNGGHVFVGVVDALGVLKPHAKATARSRGSAGASLSAAKLACRDAIIDGEAVASHAEGRPNFAALLSFPNHLQDDEPPPGPRIDAAFVRSD